MSDSRWYENRYKLYKKHGRSWDDVSTPGEKRFKKQRASRHNRRSMKQHLIVHAHVIPAHGRVINQTGKTKSLRAPPPPTTRWMTSQMPSGILVSSVRRLIPFYLTERSK